MKELILIALLALSLCVKAQTDATYQSEYDYSSYDSVTVWHNDEKLYTLVNNDTIQYYFINDSLTGTWIKLNNYSYHFMADGKMKYYTYREGSNKYCYFFEDSYALEFIDYNINDLIINACAEGFGGFVSSGACYDAYVDAGAGVKYRLLAEKEGYYDLTFNYSTVTSMNSLIVYVNSTLQTTGELSLTGDLETFDNYTISVYLNQGLNVVKILGPSAGIGYIGRLTIQNDLGASVEGVGLYTDQVAYAYWLSDIEEYQDEGTVYVMANFVGDLEITNAEPLTLSVSEHSNESTPYLQGTLEFSGADVTINNIELKGKIIFK